MKNMSIEKVFLILGFLFGCLFIYVIPPFQSPDEDSHFKKAYSISEGRFYASSNGKIAGLNVPDVMHEYIENKLGMMGQRDLKYSYSDFYYDQFLSSDFSEHTLREVSTSQTTPFAHLIPATGILCSRILAPLLIDGAPSTSFMLYFARFFSLLFYLIVGYFALKITPVFKKSMITILLLPMSLFLASMVTYDNLLIPISLLAISCILKLIYDKREMFDKKYFILFCIIGYLLLNIKVVYFPLLLLLLFVPQEKFQNSDKKEKIKTYVKIGAIVILLTVLFKLPNLFLEVEESSTLASEQFSFLLGHPFTYLRILLLNWFHQLRIQLCWMIGTFGLLDTSLPPLFIFLSFINLILTFITDGISEKIKIGYLPKIVIGCVFVLSIVGMYTAMYIDWTPQVLGIIGGNEITGVQGRYFLPLLICIPILLSNKMFDKNKKISNFSKNYFNWSIYILVTCLLVSILVSVTRFWI